MRIGVFDPTGCGLGAAVGLVELGHRVSHAGPEAWFDAAAPEASRLAGELAVHCCGPRAALPDLAPLDLVVIVDVFADLLMCLEQRQAAAAAVYPERLRTWLEVASKAARVVIVDSSDSRGSREVAFESLPQATLLARECAPHAPGPWRPFPFLYNNVLLWLEHLRPASEWWVPAAARPRQWDWAFCGTIDHPRYGDRRRRALADMARRWPALRGIVCKQVSFVDVLRTLQSVHFGIDLPGAGELCFRLHECLALGTPVLRPLPATVVEPGGLAGLVVTHPVELTECGPDFVRETYEDCYGPRAAAAALLVAVGACPEPRALSVPAR